MSALSPRIACGQPAVVLAPMEGVTDAPMRALLGELGGFSFCVSEFLRISQEVPPARVFREHVPELKTSARTPSGLPVQIQILGGSPERVAEAGLEACRLGAEGVDLNFGCPAPTVNRHDGGATLLKCPERLEGIVRAVRTVVPSAIPVSAKLRLGWDRLDEVYENAARAEAGGADWITIHGRTRMQGYTPPAYWKPIGEVRRRLSVPVVANGDIWTVEDFERCREESGCEHFMLGRSALADPSLAGQIARRLGIGHEGALPLGPSLADWLPLFGRFARLNLDYGRNPHNTMGRIKQWAKMAHLRGRIDFFDTLKRMAILEELLDGVEHRKQVAV